MFDSKLHRVHPGAGVELVERVVVVALLQIGEVCRLREVGLVVQQVEHPNLKVGFNKVSASTVKSI